MPPANILHEADAPALDRVGDDAIGLAGLERRAEGLGQRGDVMAVDGSHGPPERPELLVERGSGKYSVRLCLEQHGLVS